MSELYNKILKIILEKLGNNFSKYEGRITSEMKSLEDNGVLEDLYQIYTRINSGRSSQGTDNKVNSFVSYVLGITSKCPDDNSSIVLESRRTYGRDGFPDIDMDFDYRRRSEVVNYVIDKYGRDKVGNIGIVQTLKVKAAVRRTIKVLDPTNTVEYDSNGKQINRDSNENFKLENEILSTLPEQTAMKKPDGAWIETVEDACTFFPDFKKYMDAYPEVCDVAKKVQGRIAGAGVHAAGLILSPIPLERICPLHVTTAVTTNAQEDDEENEGKVIATQFSMYNVEAMGLIKMDVLGISTKTAISDAVKLIKQRHNIDIDTKNLPLNDKPTFDLLTSGKTDGCFQLEERGMQHALQQIGISSFDDIVTTVAMYRPGPKDYIPELSARKKGSHKVAYPHPILKSMTSVTYGIIVFQETLMKVFMEMGGLSASEGYSFIKGCAKKKRDLIEKPKEKFFQGARNKGISDGIIQKVWDDMEKFGGYAFNAAHSNAYAYEAYKTGYLKTHYPLEFMSSRLSVENERRKFDKVYKYEADLINNLGVTIESPTLNDSKLCYTIVGENRLRRPIVIKGVGLKAAKEIVNHQPYRGSDILLAFASKVGSSVNARTMEAMYDAGLWTGYKKATLLRDFDTIRKDRKKSKGQMVGDMFA